MRKLLPLLLLAVSCHATKPITPHEATPPVATDTAHVTKPLTLLETIKEAIILNAEANKLRAEKGIPKKVGAGGVSIAPGATAKGINTAKNGIAATDSATVGGKKAAPVAGIGAALATGKNAIAAKDAVVTTAAHRSFLDKLKDGLVGNLLFVVTGCIAFLLFFILWRNRKDNTQPK